LFARVADGADHTEHCEDRYGGCQQSRRKSFPTRRDGDGSQVGHRPGPWLGSCRPRARWPSALR